MNAIDNLAARKNLANCFYLEVPLDRSEKEIKELIGRAIKIEQFTNFMLNGLMSFEDLLESIEEFVPSMDNYTAEVETNLHKALIWTL